MAGTQRSSTIQPVPGSRSVLIGRLVTTPVLRETATGQRRAENRSRSRVVSSLGSVIPSFSHQGRKTPRRG